MSDFKGLGDYIHFHTENYLKYGINQVSEGPESSWEANITTIVKDKINNLKNTTQLNKYSDFEVLLNWLVQPPTNNAAYEQTGFTYDYLLKARETIYNVFLQDFEKYKPIIQENVANIEGIYMKGIHPPKVSANTKRIQTKQIVANLNALQELLNNADNQLYSEQQLKILHNLSDKLEKALTNFVEETNYMLGAEGCPKTISIDRARPFLEILNAAKFYSTGIASNQRGDLGETFVIGASLVGKHLTIEALQKYLREAIDESKKSNGGSGPIQGNVTSKVTFDPKFFPKELENQLADIIGTKNYRFENGIYVSIHGTKDKVDGIIEIPTFDSSAEKITSNASIKNTASGISIKLADSLSLLTICQTLAARGYTYMATHYLNQLALNQKTSIYNTTSIFMKLSILEQAMQGYKGALMADTLIANFNGSFRVIPMDKILSTVVSATDQINDAVSFSPSLESLSLSEANSQMAASPWQRIAYVLKAAHGIKITAHLKRMAL